MGDRRQLASHTYWALKAIDAKWRQSVYFVFYSPTSSILRPMSGLWLVNYHSYSVMASSRADSNQVGGTKRFRHAVDSNGD